jgi:hypothetical protein
MISISSPDFNFSNDFNINELEFGLFNILFGLNKKEGGIPSFGLKLLFILLFIGFIGGKGWKTGGFMLFILLSFEELLLGLLLLKSIFY